MTVPNDDSASAIVRQSISVATSRWADAVGAGSVCLVEGSTASEQKRREGAVFALSGVQRRIATGELAGDAVLQAQAAWSAGATPSGPMWDSYSQGGLEALAALRAQLQRLNLL